MSKRDQFEQCLCDIKILVIIVCFIGSCQTSCLAADMADITDVDIVEDSISQLNTDIESEIHNPDNVKSNLTSIYALPYSPTLKAPNWHKMWINTAVLSGAFVGSLFVLECLPEDATAWNRAEIQSVAPFKRWFRNIFKKGPEWDHDKFYFNYLLHPYAGAAYFMSARSCGFNMWQSLLYCTCISTIGWEFGVEAFMERPSYQDLFITPLVGSAIGEGFYIAKRRIAANNYRLCGSKVLGNIVAFLIDPVNEVIGLFSWNDARHINDKQQSVEMALSPVVTPGLKGFALSATF